jgi:hypothetical protein
LSRRRPKKPSGRMALTLKGSTTARPYCCLALKRKRHGRSPEEPESWRPSEHCGACLAPSGGSWTVHRHLENQYDQSRKQSFGDTRCDHSDCNGTCRSHSGGRCICPRHRLLSGQPQRCGDGSVAPSFARSRPRGLSADRRLAEDSARQSLIPTAKSALPSPGSAVDNCSRSARRRGQNLGESRPELRNVISFG